MILNFPRKDHIMNGRGSGIATVCSAPSIPGLSAPVASLGDGGNEDVSIQLLTAVWQLKISPHEKLVLAILADHANKDAVCWPSVATIARESSLSLRQVQKCLNSLQKASLLHRDFRSGHSTKYYLKIPLSNMRGSKEQPLSNKHLSPSIVHPRPRTMDTQNLPLESSRTLEGFSVEKEEREVTPELQEMLDNLYKSMQA